MAADPFNSIGGFTTGIPPIQVIDSNGNVTSNRIVVGNLDANSIYTDNLFYANGDPYGVNAAGNTGEIQFNNNGSFDASSNLTFDANTSLLTVTNFVSTGNVILGDLSNVTIFGGNNGYFLQTDGNGVLSWSAGGGGGGNGSPGGSNGQVQFNDNGTFGGLPQLTFNDATYNLTVGNRVVAAAFQGNGAFLSSLNAGNLIGIAPDLTVNGNIIPNVDATFSLGNANYRWNDLYLAGNTLYLDTATFETVGNNVVITTPSGKQFIIDGNNNSNTAAIVNGTSNVYVAPSGFVTVGVSGFANIVTISSTQTNVLGNLNATGTSNIGGTLAAGNITTAGYVNTSDLVVVDEASIGNLLTINASANLNVYGNFNALVNAKVTLGNVANVKIFGGVNGQFLITDGTGNLTWANSGGGGNGVPGGSNTQVQYNKAGVFGGSTFFTFDESNTTVQIAGNLVANSFTMGSGAFNFSRSNVYAATTNSSAPDQVVFSTDANDVAGIDLTVISTDTLGGMRQISKLSGVLLGSDLNYNETSYVAVGGYTGDFYLGYSAGNIVVGPQIVLKFSPSSGNLMTHKMQITLYEE